MSQRQTVRAPDDQLTRRRSAVAARIAIAVVSAVVVLLVGSPPASAHGAGGDASDFRSEITSPPEDGLEWAVVGSDADLRLTNRSGREVVVLGYEDELYLRFAPDGRVFGNARSPATYLNEDRAGGATAPATADAAAAPEWVLVAEDGGFRWHDHRAHWMAPVDPDLDGTGEQKVFDWSIPYRFGEESRALEGALWWTRPSSPWPWLVAGGVVLAVPVLAAAVLRRGDPDAVARVFAWEVLGVVALNVVRIVDDLVTVPATPAEQLVVGISSAAWAALAAGAAILVLRRPRARIVNCVVAAAATFYGLGITTSSALASAYLQTSLPPAAIRAVVALSVTIVVPAVITVLVLERRFRHAFVAERRPAPAGGADAPTTTPAGSRWSRGESNP